MHKKFYLQNNNLYIKSFVGNNVSFCLCSYFITVTLLRYSVEIKYNLNSSLCVKPFLKHT